TQKEEATAPPKGALAKGCACLIPAAVHDLKGRAGTSCGAAERAPRQFPPPLGRKSGGPGARVRTRSQLGHSGYSAIQNPLRRRQELRTRGRPPCAASPRLQQALI